MMSASEDKNPIRVIVALYENQRFFLGFGFSKRGLLPTERGPYSSDDGSLNWKTIEEASDCHELLGPGWRYEGNGFILETTMLTTGVNGAVAASTEGEKEIPGCVGSGGDNTASESSDSRLDVNSGWYYATDFSPNALRSCSRERKATHFVRRRKLVRVKTFLPSMLFFPDGDPKGICDKCDHCDTEAVRLLSDKLLECLAVATLVRQKNPSNTVSRKDAGVLILKARIVKEVLDLGSPLPSTDVDDKAVAVHDGGAAVRLRSILTSLHVFGKNQGTVLSRASQVLKLNFDEDVRVNLDARKVEVGETYFGKQERDTLAALVVKRLDLEFFYHCNRLGCGDDCIFAPIQCPNDRCGKIMSRKHQLDHDGMCEFRPIECPNGCGDVFPRNKREVHLKDVCSLRDAKCHFHAVGCTAVVIAKDMGIHLEENKGSHLLLMVDRMSDHQHFMDRMSKRITSLERENTQLRESAMQNNEVLKAGIDGANKKVSKFSKQLNGLESRCRSEFRSHAK